VEVPDSRWPVPRGRPYHYLIVHISLRVRAIISPQGQDASIEAISTGGSNVKDVIPAVVLIKEIKDKENVQTKILSTLIFWSAKAREVESAQYTEQIGKIML